VRRCYWPLLDLVEDAPWLTLAVEASGHTLERIRTLDPEWLERLRALVAERRVELVGSGDSQLIGPLVPATVNRWNQRLGQETYAELVGEPPTVALVNEMAWSQGLVDAYVENGYHALVMEWNNPRRVHPEWEDELRYRVATTRSPRGATARILWADAVAFQKLQRAVMGELDGEAYVAWVLARAASTPRHLMLYANDAEVFDYRPGRYRAEPALARDGQSEWDRLGLLLAELHAAGVAFRGPSDVLADKALAAEGEVVLNAVADPVPVKKQPKYNVTRWGLTGRNDLGLNARCFARARELDPEAGDPGDWRALCRDWASDLRTHLTDARWETRRASAAPADFADEASELGPPLERAEVEAEEERIRIRTDDVELTLLVRRGLAIESLRFPGVHDAPLVGTLPHGHFDDIDWAADFYSGHAVLDIPARSRVTDLEPAAPAITRHPDRIEVTASLATALGPLAKTVSVHADRVELAYGFSALGERPAGTLRAGIVTLLPGGLGEELSVACANGGAEERFRVSDCDHGTSVSPLVSARSVFGATEGRLALDDGTAELALSWPNWRAAALPQLTAKTIRGERFVRVAFSLAEIDETHRPGAPLYDFRLALRARRLAA